MKKGTLFLALLASFLILAPQSNAQIIQSHEMVRVDAGIFLMGSREDEPRAEKNEMVQREVKVNSFEMCKFEVAVWQWQEYVKENKLQMPPKPNWGWKDNSPINNITWLDAVNFCNWLSKKDKLQPAYSKIGPNWVCNFKANGYRLPTEAEWEFACKGGKLTKELKFSGNDDPNKIAWHKLNSAGAPHTVGTKIPNELGIYDLNGNVWEWCWDWYGEEYYRLNINDNPTGPERGDRRVVRGGSWDSVIEYLRPTNRISTPPASTHEFYGFRVVRSIVE